MERTLVYSRRAAGNAHVRWCRSFTALCSWMAMKVSCSIVVEVTNKFQWVGKFVNTASLKMRVCCTGSPEALLLEPRDPGLSECDQDHLCTCLQLLMCPWESGPRVTVARHSALDERLKDDCWIRSTLSVLLSHWSPDWQQETKLPIELFWKSS